MKLFLVHRLPDHDSGIEGVFSSRGNAVVHLRESLGAAGDWPNEFADEYISECELDKPIEPWAQRGH